VYACFLIWVYVNPPGHESWYQFVGTMVIASMPRLSGFDELGLFMFTFFPREFLLLGASRNDQQYRLPWSRSTGH
jgi:hypothetical protein